MVSDTQALPALPTVLVYHPWSIDLMVAESLLSSRLQEQVPANKKEERQRNDMPHPFKEAFQKTLRILPPSARI